MKNVEVSWRKFCQMLEEPSVDQSITYAEYCALSVDEQGKRKSAPGYIVGAHFEDGKRRLVNMKKRHLISFDLDTVTPEQMAEIDMGVSPLCDYEFERHTTRKHCPERPRWRIHLPITRPVGHDEANAITRILASRIFSDPQESIDAVDVVSHRFAQVSYLPSRSKDQEYIHERNEGDLLDPDALLDSFDGDWRDHTQLPMRSDEKSARPADPNRKMEDPREKPGIIGAWCRTYDVEQAIAEFLPDVYEEGVSTDGRPRYTYLLGSGANGAVVYDDGLFLYSNHGTDPIQGAANAWDLVQTHKFGHLDKDAREDTSPGNMPSFKAMTRFAGAIEEVRQELLAGRRDQFDDDEEDEADEDEEGEEDDAPAGIASKFDADEDEDDDFLSDFLGEEPEAKPKADKKAKKAKADTKWRGRLKANLETGSLIKSAHNVNLILQYDPGFAGTISYNAFARKTVTRKPVGFQGLDLSRVPIRDAYNGREWLDADTYDRKLILAAPEEQGGYNMEATLLDIETAVETAARNNPFHPVIEKLEAQTWDGTPRGETLFIDYLGVADNAYHRETARLWLTAAVTRLYEPGHKFDYVPILGGVQDAGKSGFIRRLGFGYFGELASTFDQHQRMVESMLGFWVLEVAELSGIAKADVETVKQFISAVEDTVRLAYRRNPETYRRQCVFMGTTNKDQYLKDETGNRRFWPIKVQMPENGIDLNRLERNVPQIYAEALVWYKAARAEQPHGLLPLYLRDPKSKAFARDQQENSRAESAAELMAAEIGAWLDQPVPASVALGGEDARFDDDGEAGERMMRRTRVRVADIWKDCLGNTRSPNAAETTTLGSACGLIPGWRKEKRQLDGDRTRWLLREGADWLASEWEPVPEDDPDIG